MKYAIELLIGGSYQRVVDNADLQKEVIVPVIGDVIMWDESSYVVKHRLIDYDSEIVVIRAAK